MKYDVVIVGAGPGGSATATFLARKGISVLLLDRATFPRDKTCGDGLTPRGVSVINRLGALDEVKAVSQQIDYAKVFAPNGRMLNSEIKEATKSDVYMLAAPRFELDNILLKNAVAAGAELQENCKVESLDNKSDHVVVHGEINGEKCAFEGKYAIIATGASMALLKKQGFLKAVPETIIAARTYYENANHQTDCFNFHFNDVTLPGYGWIFPLANNKINVGVGVIPKKNKKSENIKKLYADFAERPYIKSILEGATQLGEVQSYPIRTDFATATTSLKRTLLVGESAGLVNPLTGEGIDYAMECGEIAADHLHQIITGDDNPDHLAQYDEALKKKFMPIFDFSNRIVNCCINPIMLNSMISIGAKKEKLSQSLTNIVLGLKEPPAKITAGKVFMKIMNHMVRS